MITIIDAVSADTVYDPIYLRDFLVLTTRGGDTVKVDLDEDDFLSELVGVLTAESGFRKMKKLRREVDRLKADRDKLTQSASDWAADARQARERAQEAERKYQEAVADLVAAGGAR